MLTWTTTEGDRGMRLDAWVAERVAGVSRSAVQRAMAEGRLWLNDETPAKAGARLRVGDVVRFEPAEAKAGLAPEPEAIPLAIVHEDDDLIVVDKPAGLVVHPAPGHPRGTLVNALCHHVGAAHGAAGALGPVERPGIVHRIDKDTSGLLVVAKTPMAHEGLAAQFAAHTTHRRYRAVASGPKMADEGTIETFFGRHPRDRKRMTGRVSSGRRAVTHWNVLTRCEAFVLCELALETGRTHQIRVHLSESGHPVVADPIYGRAKPPRGGGGRLAVELAAARRMPRLALHAAELGFLHPRTGRSMVFRAPDPADLASLIATLFGPGATR